MFDYNRVREIKSMDRLWHIGLNELVSRLVLDRRYVIILLAYSSAVQNYFHYHCPNQISSTI